MLWQAFFKYLNSGLDFVGEAVFGLELGSFSSGQVADPLVKDSNRNPRAREKQSDEEESFFWSSSPQNFGRVWSLLKLLPHVDSRDEGIPGMVSIPRQGIATDAF